MAHFLRDLNAKWGNSRLGNVSVRHLHGLIRNFEAEAGPDPYGEDGFDRAMTLMRGGETQHYSLYCVNNELSIRFGNLNSTKKHMHDIITRHCDRIVVMYTQLGNITALEAY